jgi:HAD superfamily hydrolase (TIGR01450 family)
MTEPAAVSMRELLDRYDGVLLDVYGVLTDARGALPGARELIAELARSGKPYAIVTNDASRSPATYVRRFAGFGLDVAEDRIVTSGSLLPGYLRERGLAGARCAVLGTDDSRAYVRAGGGVIVDFDGEREIDALIVADDDGFDFLPGVERALSAVVRALAAGRTPALILPNPDLVYPKGGGELGLTAGAIALLIETVVARRFRERAPAFVRLGKPEPHLFAAAARLLGLGANRLVMVGDQLETDIAGAHAAGMHAALLAGVSRWEDARSSALAPHYLLATLSP